MFKRIQKLKNLYTINDKSKGQTIVIQKEIPFKIKRVFFKYNFNEIGNHTNLKTKMYAMCINGKAKIIVKKNNKKKNYIINKPDKLIFIDKGEWRKIKALKKNTTLIFFASEKYDKNEYL